MGRQSREMSRDVPLRDFEHSETCEYERDQTQDGLDQRGTTLTRGVKAAVAEKDWHGGEARSILTLDKGNASHLG